MKQVFFLGATGYIGGSLLVALKKRYPEFTYLALVRSTSAINSVEAVGVSVVHGSFSDLEKVTELSESSDVIINAADSDTVELSAAILKGLKARYLKGNGVGTLVHTSGTCNFFGEESNTGGSEPKLWTDSEADVKLVNSSMVHGQVDTRILQAGEEGYVNTFIICPSMVHGRSSGPCHRAPALTKMVILLTLERKHAFCVGDGSRSSGLIHIEDLMRAYLLVIDRALKVGPELLTSNPYARYFIVTSEQMKWKDIFTLIAEALYKKGKLASADLEDVNANELGFIGIVAKLGTYERLGRLAEMGWMPEAPGFGDTVSEDVESALSELKL